MILRFGSYAVCHFNSTQKVLHNYFQSVKVTSGVLCNSFCLCWKKESVTLISFAAMPQKSINFCPICGIAKKCITNAMRKAYCKIVVPRILYQFTLWVKEKVRSHDLERVEQSRKRLFLFYFWTNSYQEKEEGCSLSTNTFCLATSSTLWETSNS